MDTNRKNTMVVGMVLSYLSLHTSFFIPSIPTHPHQQTTNINKSLSKLTKNIKVCDGVVVDVGVRHRVFVGEQWGMKKQGRLAGVNKTNTTSKQTTRPNPVVYNEKTKKRKENKGSVMCVCGLYTGAACCVRVPKGTLRG